MQTQDHPPAETGTETFNFREVPAVLAEAAAVIAASLKPGAPAFHELLAGKTILKAGAMLGLPESAWNQGSLKIDLSKEDAAGLLQLQAEIKKGSPRASNGYVTCVWAMLHLVDIAASQSLRVVVPGIILDRDARPVIAKETQTAVQDLMRLQEDAERGLQLGGMEQAGEMCAREVDRYYNLGPKLTLVEAVSKALDEDLFDGPICDALEPLQEFLRGFLSHVRGEGVEADEQEVHDEDLERGVRRSLFALVGLRSPRDRSNQNL